MTYQNNIKYDKERFTTLKIHVYDFDKTIYKGDSTIDFYFYCLKRKPYIILVVPYQLWGMLKYKLKLCSKTKMKEHFFSFLKLIRNIDSIIDSFAICNRKKLTEWFLNINGCNNVIITASPEFLVASLLESVSIHTLIASDTDKYTGKFSRENCYGVEKVHRLYEIFPKDVVIEKFYSDSLSDLPLAQLSKEAFLIKDDTINKWK